MKQKVETASNLQLLEDFEAKGLPKKSNVHPFFLTPNHSFNEPPKRKKRGMPGHVEDSRRGEEERYRGHVVSDQSITGDGQCALDVQWESENSSLLFGSLLVFACFLVGCFG